MKFSLQPAHRLARINYAPRAAGFALIFVVVCALFAERGFAAWELVFAVLSFLVYPHVIYLHARLASDSKQAELNNLYLDSILMGVWAAQMHFATSPTVVILVAITLNNAANGGVRRLFWGSVCFAAAAAAWGGVFGYRFDMTTGAFVRGISVLGIFAYVSWVGTILFVQNKVLVRTHHHLKNAEKQLHFVAEHPGEMVSVLDAQGRLLYASPSHARHFEPSVIGTGSLWLGLVHADDRQRARQFLERVAVTQAHQRSRFRMVTGKGAAQYVECNASPAKDHHGDTTSIVVVMQRLEVGAVASAPG